MCDFAHNPNDSMHQDGHCLSSGLLITNHICYSLQFFNPYNITHDHFLQSKDYLRHLNSEPKPNLHN